jgi:hypothetical protein
MRSNIPAEEQKLAQSVAHMLDKNVDAGIAALLADADRGMAELLEDLDMVPRRKQPKKKSRRKKNNQANQADAANLDSGAEEVDAKDERDDATGGTRRRRRRAAAPPGGNAKARYARLMQKKEKRQQRVRALENITEKINSNLQRGLGVSGEMLDDLEAARRMALKGKIVPPDNAALRKAQALTRKLERMPKTTTMRKGEGGHTGGTYSIAPSVAWSTNNPTHSGQHGVGGDEGGLFFDDEEYSDNSDDEEEPFLGAQSSQSPPPLNAASVLRMAQPSLPPSSSSTSTLLPSLQDEQNVIAAAAAAMKSITTRRDKHRKTLAALRKSNPSLLLLSSIETKRKKKMSKKQRQRHSKSEASLNIDKAILEHRARQSYMESTTGESSGVQVEGQSRGNSTNGEGGAGNQKRNKHKSRSSPSRSPIRGRKVIRKAANKKGTEGMKKKSPKKRGGSYLQKTNGKQRKMNSLRASLPRTLVPLPKNTAGNNGLEFMSRAEQGQLFSNHSSKFDDAMQQLVEEENKELARQILEKQRELKQKGGGRNQGRQSKKKIGGGPLTYEQVRGKMVGSSVQSDVDEESIEEGDERSTRKHQRRRKRQYSPRRNKNTTTKSKSSPKRSPNRSPKRSPKKKKKKKKKRSPLKKKILQQQKQQQQQQSNYTSAALLLGDGGKMPKPLQHDSALRKVVCLLVLGQLSDIQSLLKIYSRNGVQGLAQRFQQSTTKNDPLSEEGTWVLENFVCVGQVFTNLWDERHGVDDGHPHADVLPGLIRGADKDVVHVPVSYALIH